MDRIKRQRFLSDMSEEEFFTKLDEHLGIQNKTVDDDGVSPISHGRLVYGLRGIQELFGCSHKLAQYYKDFIINEAVHQNGRKIITDADLALKLFDERRGAKR